MFPWHEKCDLLLLFNIFSLSVNFSVDENSHSDFYFLIFFSLRYEDNSVLLKCILFFLSFCFNEPSLVEVKLSRTEV